MRESLPLTANPTATGNSGRCEGFGRKRAVSLRRRKAIMPSHTRKVAMKSISFQEAEGDIQKHVRVLSIDIDFFVTPVS